MDKVKTFEKELEYIVDDNIKESAKTMIELLPDYFFHEAASSTGKYHPSYALGDGGLVRHTKAAVRVAYELLSDPAIGDKYTRSEKDVMIMSLILHDGLKRGLKEEKYTRFDHPILMANYVLENKDIGELTSLFVAELSDRNLCNTLCNLQYLQNNQFDCECKLLENRLI